MENIVNEEWRDIRGYEGIYQVSNFGRIKSLDRTIKTSNNRTMFLKSKILKPFIDNGGYLNVILHINNNQKNYKIHRLVAEAFIPNPNGHPCINHKDENKLNNNVDNLEWCTYKYNNNYGTRLERIVTKLNIPIYQYDLQGNFIKRWESATIASRELKLDRTNIQKCCSGATKTAYKFIWRYKKQ